MATDRNTTDYIYFHLESTSPILLQFNKTAQHETYYFYYRPLLLGSGSSSSSPTQQPRKPPPDPNANGGETVPWLGNSPAGGETSEDIRYL